MTIFAAIDLLSSLLLLFFALSIFQRNPYEKLYKYFSGGLFSLFAGSIGYFFIEISQSSFEAALAIKLSSGFWFIAAALFLHSILIFNDHPILKNRFAIYSLYIFPAVVTATYLFTSLPFRRFTNTTHGISYDSTYFYYAFVLIAGVYLLTCVFLCLRTYFTTGDNFKKYQALFLAGAFILPFFFGMAIEMTSDLFGLNLPSTYPITCAISLAFASFAANKYRLFPKYPEIAAESIFAFFPDILLVTDMDNRINLANDNFIKMVDFAPGQRLQFSPLQEVIGKEPADYLTDNVLREHQSVFDFPLSLKNRILSINATQVKDPTDEPIGMVIIGRDVTEMKLSEAELIKTTTALEDRLKEINRINKLFVERELEMVQLKEEIARRKQSNG